MAKLPSKSVPNLFGINETNPNYLPTPLGQFAGGQGVTPSLDPEILLANIAEGITKITLKQDGNYALMSAGDFAGLMYGFSYYITYILENGIPEYNASTEYWINSVVKAENGITLYRSLVNNNLGNSLTDATKWEALSLLNLRSASESQQGTLQIATLTDINGGTNNTKALTINNLKSANINFTGTITAPTQAIADNSTKLATTEFVKNHLKSANINFTGTITAPTQAIADNSTKLATTEFVKNQILTGRFLTPEVDGVWTKTPSYIQVHLYTRIPFDIAYNDQKFFNIPSGIFTARPSVGSVSIYNEGDAINDYVVGYDAPACTTTRLAIRVTEFSQRGQQAKVSIIATQIL